MHRRRPQTPSCATSWEQSSGKLLECGRGRKRPARDERERARRHPDRKRMRKRGAGPVRGNRLGTGAALFVLERVREKESGPDIAARPAYIRGANDRIRTGDLRFTRALLYQLSHVGTRLLAKREYELYRRARRFARGKSNFSGEGAGIRRFSTGLHPSVAAASPATPRPRGPSPPARGPGPHAAHSCSRCPACRAERPDRGCP